MILPLDVRYGPEATRMELIQLFDVSAIDSPSFATIPQPCQNNSHELGSAR